MLSAFGLYCSHAVFFSNQYSLYSYFEPIYVFSMLSILPLYYIYTLSLTSTFSGGISTYTFEWRNPANAVIASSQNTTLTPAVAGTYTVIITDGSGATTSSTVNDSLS